MPSALLGRGRRLGHRGQGLEAYLVLDDFTERDVARAEVRCPFDQRAADAAAAGVELSHSP